MAQSTQAPIDETRDGGTPPARSARGNAIALSIGTLLTLGLVVASLFVGEYDIFNAADGAEMFGVTRVPRTIALVLAGASMAMCGLVMQVLTQNRFVEPTTTGTTEWAGLGLLITMILFPHSSLLVKMTVAVITAFIGTMIFFMFLQRVTLRSSVIVPIVGIMLGAVVGAVSTFLALQTEMLQSLGIWFAGSFTGIIQGQWEPPLVVIIVVVVVFITADRCAASGLGVALSRSSGLKSRAGGLLATGLSGVAAGVVTGVVGNLPVLGRVGANIGSMCRGAGLRSNLPWVALTGVCIVTACAL